MNKNAGVLIVPVLLTSPFYAQPNAAFSAFGGEEQNE
jgi:hypothetical protein